MTREQALITDAEPYVRRFLIAYVRKLPEHCRDDAIADGLLGLTKAAESYQPEHGTSFRSYAVLRAMGEVVEGLRRNDHLTRGERRRQKAGEVIANDAPPVSLELGSVQADGGEVSLSETIAEPSLGPADQAEEHERHGDLYHAIDKLSDRERYVVYEIYFNERRARAVAEDIGVTESRVSQLHKKALRRMRPFLQDAA